MSNKAGTLLWNRQRITLPAGSQGNPSVTDIDTGLQQPNLQFGQSSTTEPDLARRTQVMPMVPTAEWTGITHGEPFVDATTHTVHVVFTNPALADHVINVLFWDPHTTIGPGSADAYNPPT